jgi:hypothetical protein
MRRAMRAHLVQVVTAPFTLLRLSGRKYMTPDKETDDYSRSSDVAIQTSAQPGPITRHRGAGRW